MPSTEPPPDAPRVKGASSSRKLLQLLLCFSEERPRWTVAELADELELTTTTAYRYVALLREVGLLDAADANRYRVTDLVQTLARANAAAQVSLEQASLPVMRELRDAFDETVLVARRGGDAAYCVDRVESRRPVRMQFDRGQAMTLHAGALARVLLANAPTTERERYVAGVIDDVAPERAALLSPAALDEVALAGWTQSFEEIDEGIWGCAAAIRVRGVTVAALGTAAPVYRTSEEDRARITDLVRRGAQQITDALA